MRTDMGRAFKLVVVPVTAKAFFFPSPSYRYGTLDSAYTTVTTRGRPTSLYYNVPAAMKIPLSKSYYIFLYGTLIPACAAFFIAKQPLVLVTMGTWLAAFAMAFYCPLLAYVNNRILLKELRPK